MTKSTMTFTAYHMARGAHAEALRQAAALSGLDNFQGAQRHLWRAAELGTLMMRLVARATRLGIVL